KKEKKEKKRRCAALSRCTRQILKDRLLPGHFSQCLQTSVQHGQLFNLRTADLRRFPLPSYNLLNKRRHLPALSLCQPQVMKIKKIITMTTVSPVRTDKTYPKAFFQPR